MTVLYNKKNSLVREKDNQNQLPLVATLSKQYLDIMIYITRFIYKKYIQRQNWVDEDLQRVNGATILS